MPIVVIPSNIHINHKAIFTNIRSNYINDMMNSIVSMAVQTITNEVGNFRHFSIFLNYP